MPLSDEDIAQALRAANRIVDAELPAVYTDPRAREDRRALRAAALPVVLAELLAQARVPQGWTAS